MTDLSSKPTPSIPIPQVTAAHTMPQMIAEMKIVIAVTSFCYQALA